MSRASPSRAMHINAFVPSTATVVTGLEDATDRQCTGRLISARSEQGVSIIPGPFLAASTPNENCQFLCFCFWRVGTLGTYNYGHSHQAMYFACFEELQAAWGSQCRVGDRRLL